MEEKADLPEEVKTELPEGEDEEQAGDEEESEDEYAHDPQLRTAVDILKGILIQKHFDEEAESDS